MAVKPSHMNSFKKVASLVMLLIDPYSNGKSITGQTEVHVINFIDVGVSDPSQIVVGEI